MGFKENLQKKIEINRLALRVIQSLKPVDSGQRFDKAAMRQMLVLGAYPHRQERDLDLYILENDAKKKRILVLDNGLAIYHTTIEDVCLRKSPTVKEMISIRNAIKILSDKDVVVSKKAVSVRTVQSDIIGGIDLAYTDADIEQIEKEGIAALEGRMADDTEAALLLFAELLGFQKDPRPFARSHHLILGTEQPQESGEIVLRPIVTFDRNQIQLKLIDAPIGQFDREKMDYFHQVIEGQTDAPIQGAAVFTYLKTTVPKYRQTPALSDV